MHVVRSLSPQDYLSFHERFDEGARYLNLTPADRNLAWCEATQDEHFHEWPVPIGHFLSDPYYIGPDVVVRPSVREFLTDFWNPADGYELFLFIAGLGSGKGLALDTPLPTPTGWTKMGDVQPGDELLDEAGQPTIVKWVSPVHHLRCFRVTFDDGSQIVCDEEHTWATWDTLSLKAWDRVGQGQAFPSDWAGWRSREASTSRYSAGERRQMAEMRSSGATCGEIATALGRTATAIQQQWTRRDVHPGGGAETRTAPVIRESLQTRTQWNHTIPAAAPLQLAERELPIDPWVFGYLLGDGDTKTGGRVACDPRDRAWLMAEFERRGITARPHKDTGHFGAYGIGGIWRDLGMPGGKFIPELYRWTARQQRLELLRGLIDSDGSVRAKGQYEFSTTSTELRDGVMWLARSLGLVPRCYESTRTRKGVPSQRAYQVSIPSNLRLANLARKADRARHEWGREQQSRRIVAIEEIPSVPTRCLSVDSPRELFLAGKGMIPTHNSFSATLSLLYALYQLGCMKKPAKYLSGFEGAGSLSGDAEIVLMNASGGGYKQAQKIVFTESLERIVRSPWFRIHYEPYEGRTELEFPNRVRLSPGTSHWESALGWNLYAFVIDEAAFGVESKRVDYIKELFQNLNLRRRSRFGKAGFGGMFTSPGSEHGFVELLAGEQGDMALTTLVRRTTTWDAKEELKPGAEVFLLSRDPDHVKVLRRGLTYVRPGVCQDAEGGIVRFGEAQDETREKAVA